MGAPDTQHKGLVNKSQLLIILLKTPPNSIPGKHVENSREGPHKKLLFMDPKYNVPNKQRFKRLWVRLSPCHPCCPPMTAVTRPSAWPPGPGAPLPRLILACLAFSSPQIQGEQNNQDFRISLPTSSIISDILFLQYLLFLHGFWMLHCSFAFQACLRREIGENTVRFLDELETFWKSIDKIHEKSTVSTAIWQTLGWFTDLVPLTE